MALMILPILGYIAIFRQIVDPNKYLTEVYTNLIITWILNAFVPELNSETLQTPHLVLRIIMAIVSIDLIFGSIHRLFHTKLLWKFHVKHHELTKADLHGYNSLYSSIIEHIFANLLPAYLSSIWFTIDEKVFWFSFMLINSAISHYYDPTNLKNPGYHQIHHIYPNRNFGTSFGLFDWLIK